ncbi:hypothetical protein D9758_013564 [Tetrapyrgos nigripes]|uniref:Uncharacterized protein n=1 Tax=Tetrapyrgos nigripes TaxID=182062 RepID=A0A8H5FKY7_9AGAR|nr:hypothetical protein D9758_013564 [Tetrapyrgos nigripes]
MNSNNMSWIYMDDTDPRLNYTGHWELSSRNTPQDGNRTLDDVGSTWSGRIWNDTVHKTGNNRSSVSLGFNGTRYAVFGSFLFSSFVNSSSQSSCSSNSSHTSCVSISSSTSTGTSSSHGSVDCFLDGNPSAVDFTAWPDSDSVDDIDGNNIFICGSDNLPMGEHEVVIKVSNISDSTFFLDYVLLQESVPAPAGSGGDDSEQDAAYLQIGNPYGTLLDFPNSESLGYQLEFSEGWSLNDTLQNAVTKIPGSSVTLTFNGTSSVQLYGDIGVDSQTPNTVTYQLDDQSPQSFTLPQVPTDSGEPIFFYQQFFNLSGLTLDKHTLVVKHNGTTDGMALALEYFIVERSSASGAEELKPPSPSGTSSGHHLSRGAIGGILGGLLGVFVAVGLIWALITRRRRRRRKLRDPSNLEPSPFTDFPRPDFDPYGMEPARSDALPSNSHKHTRSHQTPPLLPQQSSSSVMRHQGGDVVGQLRWGNLKLQQRIAVLTRNQSQQLGDQITETREQPTEVVLHTVDSGWRMPRNPEIREVPPNYTEA